MFNCRTQDIDTVISDVHGADLELLIDKLSGKLQKLQQISTVHHVFYLLGIPEKASKYTWIFTSILSSEMLLQIEQLLSRTKVVSIFATADKKLLHSVVKVRDNGVQISAMETSLPYLYMLRQLQSSYLTAWSELCSSRGMCQQLASMKPRQFIQKYFNPGITARRKMATSFMLIVYRSSSADDYVDLQLPDVGDQADDTDQLGPVSSTVSAIMSTVDNNGDSITVVPTVVITKTVSTLNFTEATTGF